MNRRAILIGTNTATSPHLNGVDSDIRRIFQHLTSDFGGAWEREEITHFKAPTARYLAKQLSDAQNARPDFLIIAFSGHGFENDQGKSFICLSDGENFAVGALQVNVDRQVTIVDACRVIVPGKLAEGIIKTAGADDVAGLDGLNYRASCRDRFDARLRSVSSGRALIQSCSLGETSSDYPNGGLFTHSFIKLARASASKTSNWRQSTKCGTVETTFLAAEAETQRLNPDQLPTCRVWDQGAKLPFFVA